MATEFFDLDDASSIETGDLLLLLRPGVGPLRLDPSLIGGGGDAGRPWFMEAPVSRPDTASAIFGGNGFSAMPFFPADPVTITGVKVWCTTPGTGHTIFPGLYAGDASNSGLTGGALLASGPDIALAAGLNTLPFSAPYDLTTTDMWYWGGIGVLGSGNVNFASAIISRPSSFFSGLTSSTLANPAPSSAAGNGTNVSWWFY